MDRQQLIGAPRQLRSERLLLECPHVGHAAAFVDSLNRSLPGLQFITWGQQRREADWAEDICLRDRQLVDDGECLVFNAFLRETGAFVGRVDLHTFDFEAPRCEIGYVGDAAHQGRGLMREAVLTVMQTGFDLGLARIHAISDARNTRALRFALALGMEREGVLRAYERDPHGQLCNMVMFAAVKPGAT